MSAQQWPKFTDEEYDAPPGDYPLVGADEQVGPAVFARAFAEPEDRGAATLSELGEVEYVEDLIRPGRIVVVAAEEGTGKSYAIGGELGIRVATAGGSFAGTWPILRSGPVCYLSEMHPDDDYQRESEILDSLGLTRDDLRGRYYRLPVLTAAGDAPALQVPAWRTYFTEWAREKGALLAIFDTATAAARVDPWGDKLQAVYRDLRLMTDAYPELAIVLIVHLKKPSSRGERRLTDVLGEWGRWNDVTLLLEASGEDRVKLTTRKRVRHQRRVLALKRGGLLVEPADISDGAAPKVPIADVEAAIRAEPGISIKRLAARLGVAHVTARKYVDLVDGIVLVPGARGALTCHLPPPPSQGSGMSPAGGAGGDLPPPTPLIEKGVGGMSTTTTVDDEDPDELAQLARDTRP
jgi:hypothetical protein